MRSRYTAYVLEDVDYLVKTTLPSSQTPDLKTSIKRWMKQVNWQRLHVINVEEGQRTDSEGIVEFVAEFVGPEGADEHHEVADFEKISGMWFYVG